MITEHQKLLEQIKAAEDTALALNARGENVSTIIQKLRTAAAETQKRIAFYQSEPAKPVKKIAGGDSSNESAKGKGKK